MSKIEKLIGRLYSRPKDFTWEEMKKLLKHFTMRKSIPEERAAQGGGSLIIKM